MRPQGIEGIHPGAEDIVVLFACGSYDLDVGPVIGAQGNGAVEHELHVAGAAGLGARRGDLFGDIRRRDDMLGIGAVIVLYKDHPHLIGHIRVGIDLCGDLVDEFDDCLGNDIPRSGFGPEDKGRGGEVGNPAILDAEVYIQNGQCVHQLPLILMHTLDLHVIDEPGRNIYPLFLGDKGGKPLFVLPLYGQEVLYIFIRGKGAELFQLIQIGDPPIAYASGDKIGQPGVAKPQPTPLGNAVGFVLEAFGVKGIPVLQHIVLEDLRMDLGHAIDRMAYIHGHVGHVDPVPLDDGIIGAVQPLLHEFPAELGIDAVDDIKDLR